MPVFKRMLLIAGASVAVIAAGAPAGAEPLIAGKEFLPDQYIARITAGMNGLAKMDSSDTARGFYRKLDLWPPSYTKLLVCFMGGSDELNTNVAKVAKGWNRAAKISLRLDLGKNDKPRRCKPGSREAQIRVSYDKQGYYSLLGQNSMVYASQEENSLNLGEFDKFPDPNAVLAGELKGVILHEFGHALGLYHEHQSPVANCDGEYNWEYIFTFLKGPPNNWDEAKIKFNMDPYPEDQDSEESLMMTKFDAASVMLYSFPADYYLKGNESPCFIESSNTGVSASDKLTIENMYPVDVSSRLQAFEQNRAQIAQIIKQAEVSGTKAAGMDYLDAFFNTKGVADGGEDKDGADGE